MAKLYCRLSSIARVELPKLPPMVPLRGEFCGIVFIVLVQYKKPLLSFYVDMTGLYDDVL